MRRAKPLLNASLPSLDSIMMDPRGRDERLNLVARRLRFLWLSHGIVMISRHHSYIKAKR